MSRVTTAVSGDERHRGRALRWSAIGLLVGAVVATVAVLAMVTDGPSDAASPSRPTSVDHLYPSAYGGDVWITVTAPDARARNITITWGPWQRSIEHRTKQRRTYVFTKYPTRAGEQNVAVHVEVTPGAKVKFGAGRRPPDAVDVNDGWTPSNG